MTLKPALLKCPNDDPHTDFNIYVSLYNMPYHNWINCFVSSSNESALVVHWSEKSMLTLKGMQNPSIEYTLNVFV